MTMSDEEPADLVRREEILQRAIARSAELRQREHDATKAAPAPKLSRRSGAGGGRHRRLRNATSPIASGMAEARTIRGCMAAVGEMIGKDLVAAERGIAALEAEVCELRAQLEQATDRRAGRTSLRQVRGEELTSIVSSRRSGRTCIIRVGEALQSMAGRRCRTVGHGIVAAIIITAVNLDDEHANGKGRVICLCPTGAGW